MYIFLEVKNIENIKHPVSIKVVNLKCHFVLKKPPLRVMQREYSLNEPKERNLFSVYAT